jgi:hypothetical protein
MANLDRLTVYVDNVKYGASTQQQPQHQQQQQQQQQQQPPPSQQQNKQQQQQVMFVKVVQERTVHYPADRWYNSLF